MTTTGAEHGAATKQAPAPAGPPGRRRARERTYIVGIVLGALAIMAGMLWSGAQHDISGAPITGAPNTGDPNTGDPNTGGPQRVVILGVPGLGLADLDSPALPTLRSLAEEGALAGTNVRTLSGTPTPAEAYATLGAGARVAANPAQAGGAYPPDAPLGGGTAGEVLSRRVGEPVGQLAGSAVVVPAMPSIRAGSGEHIEAEPGALGTILREAGIGTAVISNADHTEPLPGSPPGPGLQRRPVDRPAAVAMADARGVVPAGTVDPAHLLVTDPTAPYGHRADIGEYVRRTFAALDRSGVVLVDLGDTARAASHVPESTRLAGEAARQDALNAVDDYLRRLVPRLEDDTMLMVVGVTPPSAQWGFTPTILSGAGVGPGTLHSPAVNRDSLVALTDVAPTILDLVGAEPAPGMIGQPLQLRPGAPDLAGLNELGDHADSRETVYRPMVITFITLSAFAYLTTALLLAVGRPGRRVNTALQLAVLTCAAWPLATFAERAVPGTEHTGVLRHGIVWALALAIAAGASRSRRGPLTPLAWIAGATVALLVIDVATGANLQQASLLGYSPHVGARYVGFGNIAFAVLGACAIVLVSVYVQHAVARPRTVVAASAVLTVVLLADVWPTLGADVGGVLTLVPVFGLLLYALAGRRLSWRTLAVAGLVTVLVLAAVTAVDLLRPQEDRSHLGRYVASVLAGGDFWTLIERKWAVNMRVFGGIWTWVVPIVAAFGIYVLAIRDGWARLVPPRSALRAGLVALIGAGVLGWLVNDSGIVITAIVFGYLGSYVALLALRQDEVPDVPAERDDHPPSLVTADFART